MGATRTPDSFGDYGKEVVQAVIDKKVDGAQAEKIEEKKRQILDLIENTMGFRDAEKKEYTNKLEQHARKASIDDLNTLSKTVERRRVEVTGVINQYFSQIDNNEQLFAKRNGYDAAKMYKEEFIQLSDSERQFRLNQLAADIAERQKLHEELSAYASPEALSRMRRSEMRRMLMYVKGCDRLLDDNKGLFTPDEIHNIKAEMADCTSQSEQQRLMTKIAGQLEKRKRYADIYKRLPANYQQLWGNISTMSLSEREANYEKLIVHIEREYEAELRKPFIMKHIAAKDRAEGLAYVRSEKTSGGDKFRALKSLKSMAERQKKAVSDPFERTLKELAEHRSPREIKKLEDRFYDADTYDKRKQLSDQLKVDVLDAQAESQEKKDLTKEYRQSLDAALTGKIIAKKTHKKAFERWNEKTLEEMRDTLALLSTDRARRTKLLKQFRSLPKEIQDKNIDFYELSHTERALRMEELSEYEPETPPQESEEESTVKETVNEKETHETTDQQIGRLVALATSATRNHNYELAIKYYQQVLAIDPYDELTKMNLEFVEGKMKEQEKEAPKPQLSTNEKNRMKQALESAANAAPVLRRRRQFTTSKKLVKQQKKSEAKHGSAKFANKKAGKTVAQQKLAQQVAEQSGGTKVMVNGKAEESIWYSEEGYRDLINPDKELHIERQLAKGEAAGNTMDNVVAYKDDGSISNASNAEKNLKKREKETQNLIVDVAKNKLNPANDNAEAIEEALQEETEKKDLEVQLRSG